MSIRHPSPGCVEKDVRRFGWAGILVDARFCLPLKPGAMKYLAQSLFLCLASVKVKGLITKARSWQSGFVKKKKCLDIPGWKLLSCWATGVIDYMAAHPKGTSRISTKPYR